MNRKFSNEEKLSLKKKGIINQKQEDFYVFRFLSDVGYFKAREMRDLAKIAETYGNGEISLTSRLTIEIPFIKEEDIEEVIKFAKERNLRIGGAGNTVRAIISCKGTVCKHGLIDTRALAKSIENDFLGMKVPGKFKIGVFGCINSYGKAQSNDFSVMPSYNAEKNEMEFMIFLGGRSGRKARKANPMDRKFKEEDIKKLIKIAIEYYNEKAEGKERFAEIIERLGEQKVENDIIHKLHNI